MSSKGSGLQPELGLYNLAAAKAAGADLEGGVGFAHYGSYLVQVRLPDPAGLVVGVTDVVPRNRSFSADITLACHRKFSLYLFFAVSFRDQTESPMYQNLSAV